MIKQQIQSDATTALKAGDSESAQILRLVISSINQKEKEKRYKIAKEKKEFSEEQLQKESELTDEEMIAVVSSEIKKRKDAIELYQKGGRPELAAHEQKEIEIIKKYLPEQLSKEVLKGMVEESIKKTGATEMKDMGKIMADLSLKVKGRADGGEVSKIVKELMRK